jgi:hypothetical protein
MKYLVMVYGNEEIWGDPAVDFAALVNEVDAFNKSLRESGEMIAVEGLTSEPRAIRVKGGVPVVSDGPYLEAKEYVGSYFVLDVDTEERALQLAKSYPGLRHGIGGGGLELWPLMSLGDAQV